MAETAETAAAEKLPLAKAFAFFDTDGDGKISKEEFVSAMTRSGGGNPVSPEKAIEQFDRMDVDADGNVSYAEFVSEWQRKGDPLQSVQGKVLSQSSDPPPSSRPSTGMERGLHAETLPPIGLVGQVDKIKEELGFESSLKTAIALHKANEMMGLPSEGPLPAQAAKLLAALGI